MKCKIWNIIIPLAVFVLDSVVKRVMILNNEIFVNRMWFGLPVSTTWFFLVTSAVMVFVLVVWIRNHCPLPLGLVLVGGTSNMIDRLVHGGVVDYLHFGSVVLNIADLSIWIGCVMIIVLATRKQKNNMVGDR